MQEDSAVTLHAQHILTIKNFSSSSIRLYKNRFFARSTHSYTSYFGSMEEIELCTVASQKIKNILLPPIEFRTSFEQSENPFYIEWHRDCPDGSIVVEAYSFGFTNHDEAMIISVDDAALFMKRYSLKPVS
jgi:hypothetical protein